MWLLDWVLERWFSIQSWFWVVEPDPYLWRTSLFLYAKYDYRPYFTYWRATVFSRSELRKGTVEAISEALRTYAEKESEADWALSETVKIEKEQVLAHESQGIGVNRVELSRSDGREPTPRENRVGFMEDNNRFGLGKPEYPSSLDKYLED